MFVFHSIGYLLGYLKNLSEATTKNEKRIGSASYSGLKLSGLEFMPVHTINAVLKILIQEKWRGEISRVVVYGCGNLDIFKELDRVIGITDIMMVDTNEELLDGYKNVLANTNKYKCRHQKLTSSLCVGSIGDPDSRTQGTGAVLAIEVIQHLYPDVLEALPYNIFGFIKPKLAIFTTVNADFNVVFQNLNGFRSEYHKFEWTREQFEGWALNICTRFPEYSVYFKGIGSGIAGTEQLGCCTQMAVFERCDYATDVIMSEVPIEYRVCQSQIVNFVMLTGIDAYSQGICTFCSYSKQIDRWERRTVLPPHEHLNGTCIDPTTLDDLQIWNYKMLLWVEFNKDIDNWSIEKQLLQEVEKRMLVLNQSELADDDLYDGYVKIPIFKLIINEHGQYTTITEIIKFLELANYVIEKRPIPETGKKHWCVIRPRIMRHPSTSASESGEDTDDDFWNTDKTETTDETTTSGTSGQQINNSRESTSINRSQTAVNDVIDDILVNLENRQEGQQNDGKEGNNKEPLEGNYNNVIVYGRVKLESQKNGYTSAANNDNPQSSEACTSKRNKNDFPSLNNVEIKELKGFSKNENNKTTKQRNYYDENEADAFRIPIGPEINNRLKSNEHKFNKTNIKDALLKMASNIETNNKNSNSRKEPIAGTSKVRKKMKSKKPETEEDLVKEDMKSLTTCIVYNSLNTIESNQTEVIPDSPIIPLHQPDPTIQIALSLPSTEQHVDIQPESVLIVQDHAGSSAAMLVENLESTGNVVSSTIKFSIYDDNNDGSGSTKTETAENQETPEFSLNYASREALFDPNSEIDMLDDLDMPTTQEPSVLPQPVDLQQSQFLNQNVVVIGVRINSESTESVALPQNADPFPNWLLQLLGANVLEDGEAHDEPHFYCQGDGIGVHPSIVEVDIEEELSSSESTTSNDDAAESTISENEINQFFDDIPFEDIPNHEELDNAVGPLPSIVVNSDFVYSNSNDSADEFFDTIDDPSPRKSNSKIETPKTEKEDNKSSEEASPMSNNRSEEATTSHKKSDTVMKPKDSNIKKK